MKLNVAVVIGCSVLSITVGFVMAGCASTPNGALHPTPDGSGLENIEVLPLKFARWGNWTLLNDQLGITAMHVYSASGIRGDEGEASLIPVAWGSSDQDSVSSDDWVLLQTTFADSDSSVPDNANQFILDYHFTEGERVWNVGYQVFGNGAGLHFERIVTSGSISTSRFLQQGVAAKEYQVKWDEQFKMAGLSGSPILIWDEEHREWSVVGIHLATARFFWIKRGIIRALPKEIGEYLEPPIPK